MVPQLCENSDSKPSPIRHSIPKLQTANHDDRNELSDICANNFKIYSSKPSTLKKAINKSQEGPQADLIQVKVLPKKVDTTEERPSQVKYDGIQDRDKHFLDEFDDRKKTEVLQIFWKELWPKLYALGWREQKCNEYILFVPPEGSKDGTICRTISELVSNPMLTSNSDLQNLIKTLDSFKLQVHNSLDWKNVRSSYPKKSSLVGPLHQVSSIPNVKKNWTKGTHKRARYDQCWDYKRARTSTASVYSYLTSKTADRKEFALTALHENSYRIEGTDRLVEKYMRKYKRGWTPKEKKNFNISMWTYRKNLAAVAKTTGRNCGDCLLYYLTKYKGTAEYKQLKASRIAEREKFKNELHDERCEVCDDGGNLLICESCDAGYHLECLSPPLKEIPSCAWYCPKCAQQKLESLKADIALKNKSNRGHHHNTEAKGERQNEVGEITSPITSSAKATLKFSNALLKILSAD